MRELTIDQITFIESVVKDNDWKFNPETGLVDVFGNVGIWSDKIKDGKIPVSFGKVTGGFYCSDSNLITLEGCPYWVGVHFDCNRNKITSMKYAPLHIGGDVYMRGNSLLEKLEWVPDYVGLQLFLSLREVDKRCFGDIIPEVEAIIDKGIRLYNVKYNYNSYRDEYFRELNIRLASIL